MSKLTMVVGTDENFEAETTWPHQPVLVKFGAEWCGPCKSLEPILVDLAEEYVDRVKFITVDVDGTSIAQNFGIRGVPTILIFKDGQVVNTIVGSQSKGRLQLAIDAALA